MSQSQSNVIPIFFFEVYDGLASRKPKEKTINIAFCDYIVLAPVLVVSFSYRGECLRTRLCS